MKRKLLWLAAIVTLIAPSLITGIWFPALIGATYVWPGLLAGMIGGKAEGLW